MWGQYKISYHCMERPIDYPAPLINNWGKPHFPQINRQYFDFNKVMFE